MVFDGGLARMLISGFTSPNSLGGSFHRVRAGPGPLKKASILSLAPRIDRSFCLSSNSTKHEEGVNERNVMDLGEGSEAVYVDQFLTSEKLWEYYKYLDLHIHWTRPAIHALGKPSPGEVCYVASKGLKEFIYDGYTPYARSWDDYPPLKELLEEVHQAFPGSHFNSLLINRYESGDDDVGWHADVNKELYGPTPEIATLLFPGQRDFFLKKKSQGEVVEECFKMRPRSLLLMRGNTQSDWLYSLPKRGKNECTRIDLTFRRVMPLQINN